MQFFDKGSMCDKTGLKLSPVLSGDALTYKSFSLNVKKHVYLVQTRAFTISHSHYTTIIAKWMHTVKMKKAKRQPDELINKRSTRSNMFTGSFARYYHMCLINTISIFHLIISLLSSISLYYEQTPQNRPQQISQHHDFKSFKFENENNHK